MSTITRWFHETLKEVLEKSLVTIKTERGRDWTNWLWEERKELWRRKIGIYIQMLNPILFSIIAFLAYIMSDRHWDRSKNANVLRITHLSTDYASTPFTTPMLSICKRIVHLQTRYLILQDELSWFLVDWWFLDRVPFHLNNAEPNHFYS